MLTPELRQRERAIFSAFILDCALAPPLLWVALQVHSLTLLAEVLRSVLLVTVAILSWATLRKIHRGQTGGYDFGLGKMEQFLSLFVAVLLCASLVFVWYRSILAEGGAAADPGFLSFLAVGLSFANCLTNAVPLPVLHKARKTGKSVLVETQFRTKLSDTLGSFVVTICVAINQLSADRALAAWADIAGVTIVTVVTLHAIYELLKSSVPDLLDRTLPEHHQIRINQVLARHYHDFDALKWCRSRQSGSSMEVHVGLGFSGQLPFAQVARITKAVVDDIEAAIPGSRVTVTPVLPD